MVPFRRFFSCSIGVCLLELCELFSFVSEPFSLLLLSNSLSSLSNSLLSLRNYSLQKNTPPINPKSTPFPDQFNSLEDPKQRIPCL